MNVFFSKITNICPIIFLSTIFLTLTDISQSIKLPIGLVVQKFVICMLILCISVCIVITKYTWSNTDNYCQHEPAKCIKLYCLDKMYNCTFYKITVQKLIDNQWSLRCYIWSDLMSIQYQPLITINTENELENLMVE